MKYLIDTHLLLWASGCQDRLPSKAYDLLSDVNNELFFSSASIWEVSIKKGLNREDFKVDPRLLRRGLLDNGYSELPIASEHAVELDQLPALHKDPFDRILIAQAMVEGVVLLTSDALLARYPGPIELV